MVVSTLPVEGAGSVYSLAWVPDSPAGPGHLVYATNTALYRVSPDGAAATLLAGEEGQQGSVDGMGSAARFNNVWSLTPDASGCILAADYDTDAQATTLRRITPDGAVTSLGTPLSGRWRRLALLPNG